MELKIEHLSKRFKDKTAVDDVSLTLTSGVWGLLGANGAGKTTLMRMIADIMVPTNGAIYYDGQDIHEMGKAYRELFGFLPQDFGYFRDFTVKDYLEYMAALKDVPARETSRKINHLLDILTLSDVKRKKIAKLSGGMKRRVGIAQAMLNDPKILVMDEPTAGLDVMARDDMLEILREYMETPGRSILISSHISTDLEGICDDIYMIDEGKILLHEETDKLLDQYGLLKVKADQYEALDKAYILAHKKEEYGYSCLTNERQYYQENYPDITIEKGKIDDVIIMMKRGQQE